MKNRTISRRGFLGFAGGLVAAVTLPTHTFAAAPSTAKLFFTDVGNGRNILLFHGWTADSLDWRWQLPVLEKQYRTIAVDLRGHGKSEVMPSGGYMPANYVADLEALIERKHEGEKFVLIGHSMGGQLAARLAVRRPDLVEAVVSVDGSLGFSADLASVFEKANNDLMAGDPSVVAPALFDYFYDPATSPDLKSWHARRAQEMSKHVIRESFGPLFVGADQVGIGQQSELFCRQLSVPFYHLCRDPKQMQRMSSWFANPKSKVEMWENAGHWIMQDRPDDVNAALTAWIDSL